MPSLNSLLVTSSPVAPLMTSAMASACRVFRPARSNFLTAAWVSIAKGIGASLCLQTAH